MTVFVSKNKDRLSDEEHDAKKYFHCRMRGRKNVRASNLWDAGEGRTNFRNISIT